MGSEPKDEQECPYEFKRITLLPGRRVWINGAGSMINRPLTPIYFLLTLEAPVTQMKMGRGAGLVRDDDLCVEE